MVSYEQRFQYHEPSWELKRSIQKHPAQARDIKSRQTQPQVLVKTYAVFKWGVFANNRRGKVEQQIYEYEFHLIKAYIGCGKVHIWCFCVPSVVLEDQLKRCFCLTGQLWRLVERGNTLQDRSSIQS
mgnify:CR=1 FL=1|jgi:hypothetical protein